jgi:hypothetical protein
MQNALAPAASIGQSQVENASDIRSNGSLSNIFQKGRHIECALGWHQYRQNAMRWQQLCRTVVGAAAGGVIATSGR